LGTAWRLPRITWRLAIVLPFLAAPIYGQSLGDIARQERAQKESETHPAAHVYDNDDLARPQILLPQDRDGGQATTQVVSPAAAPAVAKAANSNAATTVTSTAAAPAHVVTKTQPVTDASAIVDPNVDENSQPLGDIARHYRALKAARQQQAAQSAGQNGPTAANGIANVTAHVVIAEPTSNPNVNVNANLITNRSVNAEAIADPNVDMNSRPLGDIARYYRALKAAREQQAAQSAEQHAMVATPALADPTFTQPTATHAIVPSTSIRAAGTPAQPETPRDLVRGTTSREVENISGSARLRVRSGDTLWALARKYLGRGRNWLRLAASNPQVTDPRRLQAGMLLRVPGGETAGTREQQVEGVRVKGGDSLWKLSRVYFGDGGAWGCLAKANPGLENANLIFPGQMLQIPTVCQAGVSPPLRAKSISAEARTDGSASLRPPAL
jgi:nucleoid-associated protein YgaU